MTEIKGVQELELIPKVVENEVKRQLHFIELAKMLRDRGVREEELELKIIDVTDIFSSTSSKVVRRKLGEGAGVYALRLRKFAGLLSYEKWSGIRLGAELAGRAKAWADVEGIFHTDELPAYGISEEEVRAVKERTEAEEEDAVVLVVADKKTAEEALKAVLDRAKEAIHGVPEETRAARPDGTTVYMRPRPGAARMYPETDIPPMVVDREYVRRLSENLPPTLDKVVEKLVERYGISKQLANQLVDNEMNELFEEIVASYKVQPSVVASTLTETLTSLKREGVGVEALRDEHFREIFKLLSEGTFAKEAVREIVKWVAQNPGKSVVEAVEALGVRAPPVGEIERTIEELIEKNKHLIEDRKAVSKLMGDLMRVYRGKVDGSLLNQLLQKKLEEARLRAS